jgi:hypothetical protein
MQRTGAGLFIAGGRRETKGARGGKGREDAAFQGQLMAGGVGSGGGQWNGAIDGGAEAEAAVQPFPVQATESALETERPRSMTRVPLSGRRRTRVDTSISPR